jgi:2-aminoethylphosphonate-pyruvate transaminase
MKDKLLFTPGPLTTSPTVKQAMMRDLGSRDFEFIETVKFIREELLSLGHVSQPQGYESVIMQGSGTFGIESVISSSLPSNGHLLVLVNGAYGERIANMAQIHGIECTILRFDEDTVPNIVEVEKTLASVNGITHLAIVHCETTAGIFNPIHSFGQLAKKYQLTYIVDAMSSFGAVPVDVQDCEIDFLISSSNKCIEGVPGFSFVIARKEALLKCKGQSRTLTLDLFAQWDGLEKTGQFRFTPPTHSLLAFKQALLELRNEGGVEARAQRYKTNRAILQEGMKALGFVEYVPSELQGYIITSFLYPDNFDFNRFYSLLNEKGFVIYPGKLTKQNCFRIGNIGQIQPDDVKALLEEIAKIQN